MAFESGQRGQFASQINVTPLVDVMLVLLVIFMVTAPILQQGVAVIAAVVDQRPGTTATVSTERAH